MSQYPSPGQDPFGNKDPFGKQPLGQPPPYQSPYQSPQGGPEYGYQPHQQGPPFSPLALTSSICGIVSLPLIFLSCCCGIFGFVSFACGLTGVICGHMALVQFKRYPGRESGQEWALAGLICGYITVGIMVLMFIVFLVALVAPALIPVVVPNQNGGNPFNLPPMEMPQAPAN
jgi:hypothetical protein